MPGMDHTQCKKMKGLHCNLAADSENISLVQWQSPSPTFLNPSVYGVNPKGACPDQAEVTSETPWALTTEMKEASKGLHVHYQQKELEDDGKNVKTEARNYVRCTIERKFGDEIKLGHETNQDYLVYSGQNIYNAVGELVDQRTSGVQKIKVQMEAGASMGALASLTGIAAVAALLTF